MSTSAVLADAAGQSAKQRRKSPWTSPEQLSQAQTAAMGPFFALFADVDAVFTENDAMAAEKRQMSMGRLYRAWKACRAELDPEFDPKRYRA